MTGPGGERTRVEVTMTYASHDFDAPVPAFNGSCAGAGVEVPPDAVIIRVGVDLWARCPSCESFAPVVARSRSFYR